MDTSPVCPHGCRPTKPMHWVDDQWRCPKCGDEWSDDVVRPSNLTEWEYGGITFHVDSTLTARERDAACSTLMADFMRRQTQQGTKLAPTSVSRSKASAAEVKVIPSESKEDRLEALSHGLESMYDAGFYRVPCRVCGNPIKRTGLRGRAAVMHPECRGVKP